ncbi:MAG: hypothetical protein FDZ75_02840 [Actinobacteria bacterium]|nr:MAG: hypothetical protein FDZ75_02840 [Actinomycetota bacterium]
MPYAQQYASVWWGLGIGLVLLLFIYLAIRSGWFRKAGDDVVPELDVVPEPIDPVHTYPDGLAEAHGKVPGVLKFGIIAYIVFLVIYIASFIVRMQGPLGSFDRFLTK